MGDLNTQQMGVYTVVEFLPAILTEPPQLQAIGEELYGLIEKNGQRHLILNFEKVKFISSQFISILLEVKARLLKVPESTLVLCCVGRELQNVLKITQLDRVFNITDTQQKAMRYL